MSPSVWKSVCADIWIPGYISFLIYVCLDVYMPVFPSVLDLDLLGLQVHSF